MLKYLALLAAVCMVGAAVAPPALAQGTTCNSDLTIGFPNGGNTNRVIGDTVRMSLTLVNDESFDENAADNQVFTLIDFFPSCLSVGGNFCTPDPGAAAGAPPAIRYAGNLTNVNCPTAPTVDDSNPFNIKFNLVPPYDFANEAGCTFQFDVQVMEAGSNGTPTAVEQLASTAGICDSGLSSDDSGSAEITLACPVCDDGNLCNGPETCNETTLTCVDGAPLDCNDLNACTVDSCIPATGCSNVARPPDFCDDDNECTTDICVPATGCSNTQLPPDFCDDDNECTTDICVPATGCSNTQLPPDFCDDDDACTVDTCIPATGCSNVARPPDFCDDDDQCTTDTCDPVDGCINEPTVPQPPECGEAICRTPGFWATHAGVEKKKSQNITAAVLDCADGNCADHTADDFLLICGEKIDSPDSNPDDGTTDVDDAASSTEAMCVPVKGDSRLQLARQLTAAGLNCLISGGGPDCAGTGIYSDVFEDCNDVCTDASATQSEITSCISELDCLNNGNNFENGNCSSGGQDNCHNRQLVNEELGLDFDPPGPAGSSNACNAAHDTPCAVIGPGEGPGGDDQCSVDSLP